ncbi:MAG: isoprenylcysteine carboxylmethyltransferase family protein [Chloroflexota bacterium]
MATHHQYAQYSLALIAAVVNIGLFVLPSALSGQSPDIRLISFLVLTTTWILSDTVASPKRRAMAAPGVLSILLSTTLFAVFLTATIEQALRDTDSVVPVLVGGLVMLGGIVLRHLAIRTLGLYFLDDVILVPGQPLITSGIYRYLRHPSELGNLCLAIGASILLGSVTGIALVMIVLLPIVLCRVHQEDAMLAVAYSHAFSAYVLTVPALLPRFKREHQSQV